MHDFFHLINRKWVSLPRYLTNLIIAIVVYLACDVGRLLSINDIVLPISVVWPATGFSLASILIFGFEGSFVGIFLGNFLNNYMNLSGLSLFQPLLLATSVAVGSLLQAMCGSYLIRKYSSREHFATLKDIIIFLIPVGLIACLIAPLIGVISLYLYGAISWDNIMYALTIFWVGDSMGVYIFTPLLVVWGLQRPHFDILRYGFDILGMILAFFFLSFLTLYYYYPLWFLFIPLSIWVTYRFRLHGATIAVFLITIAAITTFSIGYGSFHTLLVKNPLIILVSFLQTVVATSLMLAAAMNEREAALTLIRNDNISLRNTMQETRGELAEMYSKMFVKLKFISALDQLSLHMTKHIRLPLTNMAKYIKESTDSFTQLQKLVTKSPAIETNMTHIDEGLQNIDAFQIQADKMARIIQEQSVLTTRSLEQVQAVDINAFLDACLVQVQESASKLYPDFKFTVAKNYDPFVAKILMLPEDLAYALIILMHQGVDALKTKEHQVIGYEPILKISTIYEIDNIIIEIENNGFNNTVDLPEYFSQSFFDYKVPKSLKYAPTEALGLDLVLAHDIIVHVHRGDIKVTPFADKQLKLRVSLPIESEF